MKEGQGSVKKVGALLIAGSMLLWSHTIAFAGSPPMPRAPSTNRIGKSPDEGSSSQTKQPCKDKSKRPCFAERVDLAGINVIKGLRSGVVPVRIPAPVDVSALHDFSTIEQVPNPDIEITGAGRVVGIVLSQNGPKRLRDNSANDGATLSATKFGMCAGRGCKPVRTGVDSVIAFGPGVESTGEFETARYELPAGDYNLYLLTDGAPVTVTLKLRGLSGKATMRPSAPIDLHVSEATSADPLGLQYKATDEYAFKGRGMIVTAMLTRSRVVSSPNGGHCIVKQPADPAPTDPVDGFTGCLSRVPAAEVRGHTGADPGNFHGANPGRSWQCDCDYPSGRVVYRSSFDPGLYRISQHYTTTPFDNSRAFIALWLGWS